MAEYTKTITITVTCPACDSGRVGKVGIRNGQQRFRCRDCRKVFRFNDQVEVKADNKAEGQQFDTEDIGIAIRLYYMGLSYKQIGEALKDYRGIQPSKGTIYQWVAENTDKASRILEDYKARSSGHWVADEVMVRVEGGEKMAYVWNVMDRRTRYILAVHLSPGRGAKEARVVMQKALAAADKPPVKITTDGYPGYPAAIRKVLPTAVHNISEGIDSPNNNNRSERLQGTIRSRDKTLRGLDSFETGQRFLDGWRITYNHFREHEALKYKTPAEVAKVTPPITEWADVVRSDVEVPKRKPRPRVRKDAPAKSWIAKKRAQRSRWKIENGKKGTLPYATQTSYFSKEQQEPPTEMQVNPRVKAPKPVLPEMGVKSKPRPRGIKPPMLAEHEKAIPRRLRRPRRPKSV